MKTHPILFNGSMIRAILGGDKTVTRRPIKQLKECSDTLSYRQQTIRLHYFKSLDNKLCKIEAPYKVGDVLWVRETTNDTNEGDVIYRASFSSPSKEPNIKWKPSLFMKKTSCRIFLSVTSIRVEKLKSISSKDSISEGIEVITKNPLNYYKDYLNPESDILFNDSILSFLSLWDSIYTEKETDKNPFVWVISFKRCEKPQNF